MAVRDTKELSLSNQQEPESRKEKAIPLQIVVLATKHTGNSATGCCRRDAGLDKVPDQASRSFGEGE